MDSTEETFKIKKIPEGFSFRFRPSEFGALIQPFGTLMDPNVASVLRECICESRLLHETVALPPNIMIQNMADVGRSPSATEDPTWTERQAVLKDIVAKRRLFEVRAERDTSPHQNQETDAAFNKMVIEYLDRQRIIPLEWVAQITPGTRDISARARCTGMRLHNRRIDFHFQAASDVFSDFLRQQSVEPVVQLGRFPEAIFPYIPLHAPDRITFANAWGYKSDVEAYQQKLIHSFLVQHRLSSLPPPDEIDDGQ